MSYSGIYEVGLCDAGSLVSSPVDAIAVGVSMAKTLKIESHNAVGGTWNTQFRNMLNFNWQGESMQATMFFLKKMIEWAKAGADIQILTAKQSPSTDSEDVLKFVGNNKLGIDFEYVIDGSKRTIKPILEGAMPFADAKSFIEAAKTETKVDLGLAGGKDLDLVRAPYFLSIQAPNGTDLIDKFNVKSRNFMIKTKGQKVERNITKVDYLTFTLEVTLQTASLDDIVTLLSKVNAPSILFKEQNEANYYDAFSIASGYMTQTEDFKIDDEDRSLTVKYEGDIPINYVSIAVGDGNGGAASDTDGTTGGTLTVSS